MTDAHVESLLPLKKNSLPVDKNTLHLFHYDNSAEDIVSGKTPFGFEIDPRCVMALEANNWREHNGTAYVFDKSQYGHYATNNAASLGPGRNGYAIQTNGSIQRMNTTFGGGYDLSANTLSVSTWVKPSQLANSPMIMATANGTNQRMYICINDGKWDIGIQDSPLDTLLSQTVAVTEWTHLALVVSPLEAKLYVNGILSMSKLHTGYTLASNFALANFEGDLAAAAYQFYGLIDKCYVYSRELLPAEIKAHANEALYSLTTEEEGKFSSALAIEEGTTNILPNPVPDVLFKEEGSWYAYSGATITITQNIEVPEWNTSRATRIQSTGGSHVLKYITQGISLPSTGVQYSNRICIKNIGSKDMRYNCQNGVTQTLTPGQSMLVKSTITGDGATNYQMRFETIAVEDNMDIVAYQPQIEMKGVSSAFTLWKRENTYLLYEDILPTGNFTLSFWVYRNINTTLDERYVFDNLDHTFYLINYGDSLALRGDGFNIPDIVRDDLTQNWLHIVVTKSSAVRIYINGQEVGSSAVGTFSTNKDLLMGMANTKTSASCMQGYLDEFRVDKVERSPREVMAWYLSQAPFYRENKERIIY